MSSSRRPTTTSPRPSVPHGTTPHPERLSSLGDFKRYVLPRAASPALREPRRCRPSPSSP
jgi:hypothetical protein